MSRTRVAKWDNLKFFMILCVVTGHFLGEMISGDYMGQTIYLFIYTFHMPVFIFLAGMFSKKSIKQKRYEVVIEYLIIYLFMKVLDNLGSCLKYCKTDGIHGKTILVAIVKSIMHGKDNFHFFWEDGPGWFAFAMAVFFFITMLIKDYNKKYMLAIAVFVGCIAGLDKHLGPVSGMGNHFSAMRICVFYPVFLVGFYISPDVFIMGSREKNTDYNKEQKKTGVLKRSVFVLISALILIMCFVLCLRLNHEFSLFGMKFQNGFLYALRDFLKGKCTYYNLGKIANPLNQGSNLVVGIGLWGIVLRLCCYFIWGILILAIITLSPEREYFWSWFGERTMSVFIWHKFFIVMFLYIFNGKNYLYTCMEHTYLPASICLAVIITIFTSYLPGIRMSKKLRKKVKRVIKEEENSSKSFDKSSEKEHKKVAEKVTDVEEEELVEETTDENSKAPAEETTDENRQTLGKDTLEKNEDMPIGEKE